MIGKKCLFCDEELPATLSICPRDGSLLTTILVKSVTGRILHNRYQLLQELGRGGMGVVFLALDKNLDRKVAVKMLLNDVRESEESEKRFRSEAKVASSLNHRNIVRIYDFDVSEDGLPYMVMDYVEGKTLTEILKHEKAIAPERAIRLFIQLAGALAHAHRNNIIHRDLKPDNIMLVQDEDGEELPMLLDFGIAKLFAQPGKDSLRLTKNGEIYGTPLYLSPEQCTGRPADVRSDIYSFGCIIYETLTGVPPFKGDNYLSTLYRHVHDTPPPMVKAMSTKKIAMPMALQDAVMSTLQKDPDLRPQSALDLKRLLESLLSYLQTKPLEVTENPDSEQKTEGWINQLTEDARNGDRDAQYLLGWQYFDGDEIFQSYAEALYWFEQAADGGRLDAQVMLGHMYSLGQGVEINHRKAFDHYMIAAQQGDANAEYNVGECYFTGHGVPKERNVAFSWFEKAASQNHDAAQEALGNCYEKGAGVEKNLPLAFKWYHEAAMQGNKFAQFSLGRCYENGIGTGIDMSDAVYWISSAALSGHEIAQLHLGQLYQDGVLVRKDTEQAIKWFGKAADNGDAMAQGLLAKIYEELRISAKSTGSVQWGKYKMDFTLLSDGSAIHQMGMSETVGMIAQSICYELHKYDLYYDMPADEVRNLIRAIQTNNPRVREWDYIREGTEIRIPGYVVQKLVTEPGTD